MTENTMIKTSNTQEIVNETANNGSIENQSPSNFEPYIVVFACNWCTYTGSDQAGRSRMQRPANVRIIRLMCSGRMDMQYITRTLLKGADGVVIGACHLGDCHYLEGNYKAVRRFPVMQKAVEQFGINPKRVQLWHISASEGAEFTEKIKEYVEELRKLGPSPLKQQAKDKALAQEAK